MPNDDPTQTATEAGHVCSTAELCNTAQPVERFIDPAWIKTSNWPSNIIPAGAIAIDQASENGDCTVKGFYDPATGEFHVQEVLHNASMSGPQRPTQEVEDGTE